MPVLAILCLAALVSPGVSGEGPPTTPPAADAGGSPSLAYLREAQRRAQAARSGLPPRLIRRFLQADRDLAPLEADLDRRIRRARAAERVLKAARAEFRRLAALLDRAKSAGEKRRLGLLLRDAALAESRALGGMRRADQRLAQAQRALAQGVFRALKRVENSAGPGKIVEDELPKALRRRYDAIVIRGQAMDLPVRALALHVPPGAHRFPDENRVWRDVVEHEGEIAARMARAIDAELASVRRRLRLRTPGRGPFIHLREGETITLREYAQVLEKRREEARARRRGAERALAKLREDAKRLRRRLDRTPIQGHH